MDERQVIVSVLFCKPKARVQHILMKLGKTWKGQKYVYKINCRWCPDIFDNIVYSRKLFSPSEVFGDVFTPSIFWALYFPLLLLYNSHESTVVWLFQTPLFRKPAYSYIITCKSSNNYRFFYFYLNKEKLDTREKSYFFFYK